MLAGLAHAALGLPVVPDRDEIRLNVFGINHFTWIDRAEYQGHNLLLLTSGHIENPAVLRPYTREEVETAGDWFQDHHQIKFELFKRYGCLAAAGDRHLAEFVPGFTHSPEELFRWGIIRTPVAWRIERWKTAPQVARGYLDGKQAWTPRQSGEEALRQIKALLGFEDFITNVNTENIGQVSNLPLHAVVETNAHFSRNRVTPITAGVLPPGVHGLISRHVANQEMIIEAALSRDKELAFQAIFNDPTTRLPIDQAWAMFNEIGLPEGFW